MSKTDETEQSKSLSLADLQSYSDVGKKSFAESLKEKELRDIEFKTHCLSLQRDIASARDDLEELMIRSFAYANAAGVASDGICLPRKAPRHGAFV